MSRSRIAVAFLFILALMVPARAALAYEPVDADALIKACEAPAKKFWSTDATTSDLAKGEWTYAACLEDVFQEQYKVMFDQKEYPVAWARDDLAQLRVSVVGLYSAIYMRHRGCPCGTIGYILYPGEYSHILERLIRQLVKERNEAGARVFGEQRK